MGHVLIAITAVAACMIWFTLNDRQLPVGAQRLEFVFSPKRAEEIARQYDTPERRARVDRALLVDSIVFVPAYVVALSWSAGPSWMPALIAAGVLDLLENGGIALEVHKQRYGLAPFVGSAAAIKWLIVIAAILESIARFLA